MANTYSIDHLVAKLRNADITATDFINKAGASAEYKQWCKDHGVKPDEDNAAFFTEMSGLCVLESDFV